MNADVCAKVGPDFVDELEVQQFALLNDLNYHLWGKGKGKSGKGQTRLSRAMDLAAERANEAAWARHEPARGGMSAAQQEAAWARHYELAGDDLIQAANLWLKGEGTHSLGKGKSSHSLGKGKGKANVDPMLEAPGAVAGPSAAGSSSAAASSGPAPIVPAAAFIGEALELVLEHFPEAAATAEEAATSEALNWCWSSIAA